MRHPYKTALLVIGDILVLYLSLIVMLVLRYGSLAEAPLLTEHIVTFSVIFVLWLVVFFIHNLYDFTAAKNSLEFFGTVFRALFINAVIALGFFYLVPYFDIAPKRNLFIFLVVFTLFFALWRHGANRLFKAHLHIPTLLMGADEKVAPLAATLNENPQIGYRVIGVFTDKLPAPDEERSFFTYTRGDFLNLSKIVDEYDIQTIIVEEEILRSKEVIAQLDALIGRAIAIVDFNNFKERLTRKVDISKIDELWFFEHAATGRDITYDTLKRLIDIVAVLIFAAPALVLGLIVAALVKAQDGGAVFYKQMRTGQYGNQFELIKFRTMTEDPTVNPDATGETARLAQDHDPRITPIGRILRKTRLDELPQFINILRGDLSFVGPRAERAIYDERFLNAVSFYDRRYLVKPGVTGWAQINYSSVLTLEDAKERMAYDFFYIKNRSLIFDIGIILRTIDIMLRGMGR